MKRCSICQKLKTSQDFNYRNTILNEKFQHCKECQSIIRKKSYLKDPKKIMDKQKESVKLRRDKRKKFIRDFKQNKPCKDCNKIYPYYVMDFDHLPQYKKEIEIASRGAYLSEEKLLDEFKKCEVACANCHRIRTYNRNCVK